jgi:hypothetical protein
MEISPMPLILLPFLAAAAAATIAPAATVPAPERMLPGYAEPATRWTSVEQALRDRQCGDTIRQVRDAAGQPALDREPGSAERPPLIAAVDKRIDGCAVIQMHGNVNDLRPLNPPADTPPRLSPAH